MMVKAVPRILDCTLRDGGYVNDWRFGEKCIHNIIHLLADAGIDIVECGFLRDVAYHKNQSVFSSVRQVGEMIGEKRPQTMYVAMIAIGDIAPEKIEPYDGTSIDGIRLTYHKHEFDDAVAVGRQLMDKGYKLFMQPVGTVTYTDLELLKMVERLNQLRPYAFYIVDTLGSMYEDEVLHMFRLVDRNLAPGIVIGFHSHNNLQLAFSNAQALTRQPRRHELIMDASVFGMGRGAGNLCTELITNYLNRFWGAAYGQTAFLEITDGYLLSIRNEHPWGYSVPFYLAASKNCHPNYAEYLLNREKLTANGIDGLLERLPVEKRPLYDRAVIDELYHESQSVEMDDHAAVAELKRELGGRNILVIGPGASAVRNQERIRAYIAKNDPVMISVNFIPDSFRVDWMFINNRKRFLSLTGLSETARFRIIATSNLGEAVGENGLVINYASYVGKGREPDNAACMLLRLLAEVGVSAVAMAGLDGYSAAINQNYYSRLMADEDEKKMFEERNQNIRAQLAEVAAVLPVRMLTPSLYANDDGVIS